MIVISPDQVDCLRLVSLWTEVLRIATISVASVLGSEERKQDKEIWQDENAVIDLLLPAYSCWTNKLTSNRLLIRARHVFALTPSTPVSSNGHFGEAQFAVVITWSHCTTSAHDNHHMPIYSHLALPTTTLDFTVLRMAFWHERGAWREGKDSPQTDW